ADAALLFGAFFFQAEDGIRDFHVTGVQTCALPISRPRWPEPKRRSTVSPSAASSTTLWCAESATRSVPSGPAIALPGKRSAVAGSEERRVGKEGRSRRRPGQENKDTRPRHRKSTRH